MSEPSDAADRQCTRKCSWVAAAIAVMAASLVVVKTGRDALYVQGDGIYSLPFGYLAMAGFAMPVGFGMIGLMRGLGVRVARVVSVLSVALLLFVYYRVAVPGGGVGMTAFFVSIPLLYSTLFSAAWLLAAELLEGARPDTMTRAYTRIGAGAILGGLAGGLLARSLSMRIEPTTFILIGAALLATTGAILGAIQRVSDPCVVRSAPVPRPRFGDLRGLLGQRYSRLLLVAAVLLSTAGLLVEFQFYWVASQAEGGARETAQIFASVYLALNLFALGAQVLLIPRLHSTFGVHGCLVITPVVLLGGAGLVALTTAAGTRAALRVAEGALKASVHRSSWELSFAAYQGAWRPLAKLATGMVSHLGEGLAAVAIYLWLRTVTVRTELPAGQPAELNLLLLAIAGLLVLITASLRRALTAPCDYEECEDEMLLPDCCGITAQGGREIIEDESGERLRR